MANRMSVRAAKASGQPLDPNATVRAAYDVRVRHTTMLRDEQYRRYKVNGIEPSLGELMQEAIEFWFVHQGSEESQRAS
jgi:hypothetical protein